MGAAEAAGSTRALILAPHGRDAAIAEAILNEARLPVMVCGDLPCLLRELCEGAGVVLVVEEAMQASGYPGLVRWIEDQPAWSDMPIVLLALRGGGIERNPAAQRLAAALGNVTFLERPFHPTTLVSVVETALRGRRRQYEARDRIETIRAAEALLERRVEERTTELASANHQLAGQIAERERVEGVLRQTQRLEAVGQLTSGVAHDFNNLLMVVLGNIRQMQKTVTDPASRRRLQMMAQAAERGAQLTAQMLAFSRRQRLEPRAVDLNDTVAGMRDLLQATMGGSVRIETVLQPRLWPAMIDPTQIELVILNLAINARDAMEVGGTLTVETGNVALGPPARPEEPTAGDYVMVAVTDTGSGMTPDVLAKVFEPFFTTKEVGKGSGLGLSQVFGVAKQSGGGVRIDSTPGAGASVRVFLPRAAAAALPEGLAPVAEAVGPPARDFNVLLVDDDSAVREVTAGILQDLGYRVVEAGSGGAALDLLDRQSKIDLLLVDFAMPGMNGAEVAREVHARRPGLPVLFVTGYADTEALATAGGGDGILRKPFLEEDLAARLRAALGTS
ncbi:MAG TPA: response regulator [Phenylobacterium sp.]|jgi:signal transduction histidine kinase|uniref:response regulator n=1 Tax=Phenylobacterium sp. TaxID=1871053 RepID=UPI002C3D31BD|nr:response regulator [Phenylobacterium sp.]HXA38215.1 response regulator [Phenylobacterium sp.]